MTERAHPLDSVCEALENILAYTVPMGYDAGNEDAAKEARAALQVARAMREAAVVGWVERGTADVTMTNVLRADLTYDGFVYVYATAGDDLDMVRALLIPLPPETEEAEHG